MDKEDKKSLIPTIYDVAREAGVSYSTVSRTLTGYEFVKPSTREKVLQAAEKLGYVPNQQARSLAGGRSNLIGVLVPGSEQQLRRAKFFAGSMKNWPSRTTT